MSLPPLAEDRRSRRFADGYDRVFAEVERTFLGPIRTRLVGQLTGRVAEIGAGTGANVRHYAAADHVTLVEPFPAMRTHLQRRLDGRQGGIPMEAVDGRAEALPFEDGSLDAVVSTLVLCSVADVERALTEVSRVLAPGGVFAYLEHSRGRGVKRLVPDRDHAPDHQVCRWVSTRPRPSPRRSPGWGPRGVEEVRVPSPLQVRLLPEWPLIAGRATGLAQPAGH
jgi:ubiquinone/menaquinone biosynthesis C-methylase UbiE